MNKIAVITGATAGIGKACAEKFAANQYNLIITGRRNDRLSALQTDLEKRYHIAVLPLCFDVQDKQAVDTAFGNLPQNWQSIDVLINNAGLALVRESFEYADMTDW